MARKCSARVKALLVAVAVPGGLALREVAERNRELREARSALEQEQARSAAGSRAAAEAERLRAELDASRGDLAREREALAAARSPQANVPILFLSTERSGSTAGEPSRQVRLPRAPGWIVLALEIGAPHQPSYRAVLRDAAGGEIWRGEGLRLSEMETLSLSLPSTLLAPGDYTVAVDGHRFTFRALPPS